MKSKTLAVLGGLVALLVALAAWAWLGATSAEQAVTASGLTGEEPAGDVVPAEAGELPDVDEMKLATDEHSEAVEEALDSAH